jgi:prolyl oligopeptidase
MIDAVSAIKQYDYSGKLIRDIQLPGLGTAGRF